VVLVDADAVVAEAVGQLQLVEVPLVVLLDSLGITQLVVRRRDPDALVLLLEVVGQLPIGHQVEEDRFHTSPPRWFPRPGR